MTAIRRSSSSEMQSCFHISVLSLFRDASSIILFHKDKDIRSIKWIILNEYTQESYYIHCSRFELCI